MTKNEFTYHPKMAATNRMLTKDAHSSFFDQTGLELYWNRIYASCGIAVTVNKRVIKYKAQMVKVKHLSKRDLRAHPLVSATSRCSFSEEPTNARVDRM